jgi:cytoskeletal protein CcmA (bactofilin family)
MAAGEGTTATIGKSVQIRGEVRGNEDLLIEGFVEGTITLEGSRLTVGANARVQADLQARDIILLGTVVGNVTASGRVELRGGANLTGDIQASRLAIEENASFAGKVDLVQTAPAAGAAGTPVAAS